MNEELIEDKLETHEKRLNNHGNRLDELEKNSVVKTEIKKLCDS